MSDSRDSISNVLREISNRLDRLERRGSEPACPSVPPQTGRGIPNASVPPLFPELRFFEHPGRPSVPPQTGGGIRNTRIPPLFPDRRFLERTGPNSLPRARENYAEVSARQPPPGRFLDRRQTPGRVNSTYDNRVHPGVRARRPPVSSSNRDFWFLINTIFNLVRLEHHRTNWLRLPTKVGTALGELMGMISPPLPSTSWTNSMCSLERDIATSIIERTKSHIETQRLALIRALNLANPEGIEDAARLAKERLHSRYGNRIRSKHMTEYFQEVLSHIGTNDSNSANNLIDLETGLANPVRAATPTPPSNLIPAPTPLLPTVSQRKRVLTASPETGKAEETDGFVFPRRTKRNKGESPNSFQGLGVPSSYAVLESDDSDNSDNENNNDGRMKVDAISIPESETIPTVNWDLNPSTHSGTPKRTRRSCNLGDFVIPSLPPKVPDSVEVAVEPIPAAPLTGRSNTDDNSTKAGTSGRARDLNQTEGSGTDPQMEATYHDGRLKSKWSVSPRPSTRVLVLGDSNMKLAKTPLNSEYEIHAFSGAYIAHMYTILSQSELDPPISDVVIAVGINHGEASFDFATLPDLRKLARQAETLDEHVRVHFLGISTPEEANANIRDLNRAACQGFGDRYIPPLPVDQVSICRTDNSGIHHDSGTVHRILKSIKTHLSQPKFLNEF